MNGGPVNHVFSFQIHSGRCFLSVPIGFQCYFSLKLIILILVNPNEHYHAAIEKTQIFSGNNCRYFARACISQSELTLNEAVRIALGNSTSVSNLRKSLQIQELSTSTARGSLFPDLSMNASWTRNNTFSEGTVRFENGVPIIIPKQDTWINNFRLGLSTQVTVFDGFNNYAKLDLQKENEKTLMVQLDKETNDIAYNVNNAYFNVLKKDKIVAANEQNLKDSKDQLERINEYLNVGKRTLADVYRQDVQVAQNELAVERAKNDLSKSKVDLLSVMNENVDMQIGVADLSIKSDLTDAEIQMILQKYANSDALYNQALQKRFDYKSGLQDVRTSRMQYEIDNKSVWWPSILGLQTTV